MKHMEKSNLRQWIEALVVAGLVAFALRSTLFGLYHVPTGSAIPTVLVGDRVFGNKLAYRFGRQPKRGDLIIFDDASYKFDRSNKLIYWWQKYVGLPIPFLVKSGPINVTKRIIALPGDTIESRVEDGKPKIYLNGKELYEPYINPYPLILLKKDSGLLPIKSLPLPGFLRRTINPRYCAYDPTKNFASQPYLTGRASDVIYIPHEPELTFRMPYTPTDDKDSFGPMRVPEGKYWVMGDNRKESMDSRWFGFLDEDRIQGRMDYILYSIDSNESIWLFDLLKHPIDFWRKLVRWGRFFRKPTPVTEQERQIHIPSRREMLIKIAKESRAESL